MVDLQSLRELAQKATWDTVRPPLKIYIASSWRNPYQPFVVRELRHHGHQVYDFRAPSSEDTGFSWREVDPNWERWTAEQYAAGLEHPAAVRGHKNDMNALNWCDVCVLVLPSGRSASWELGYAMGKGKSAIVHMPDKCEPELMYRGATIVDRLPDLVLALEALARLRGAE
jgi:hypothetical protein